MSAREEILNSVRRHAPAAVPLPDLEGPWITYPDRAAQFAAVLASVGGRCLRVKNLVELNEQLASLPEYAAARKIVSLVPGVGQGSVDFEAIADPHELEDVHFAVLSGEFAVAENAAVWVTDERVKHRVIYFICQHLALVVPSNELVDNMPQAYERLSFHGPRFGMFISGPSKTADIEQSLVIGAHGARSLTVFLLDE